MNLFKKNYKTVFYFFSIGFMLNSIPHTLDLIESKKNARLEILEKKILYKQKEEICKEKIEFSKFFKMGFEETAQKRLISCINKSNLIK